MYPPHCLLGQRAPARASIATSPFSRFICRLKRSEEHTSELQSHVNLVCRLLLEKKKAHLTNTANSACPPPSRPRMPEPYAPVEPSLPVASTVDRHAVRLPSVPARDAGPLVLVCAAGVEEIEFSRRGAGYVLRGGSVMLWVSRLLRVVCWARGRLERWLLNVGFSAHCGASVFFF